MLEEDFYNEYKKKIQSVLCKETIERSETSVSELEKVVSRAVFYADKLSENHDCLCEAYKKIYKIPLSILYESDLNFNEKSDFKQVLDDINESLIKKINDNDAEE